MGWRTSGCGEGVGCDDTQSTPLCIIQGQPLDVSFETGYSVEGQQVRAEIRATPGGRLILNMAPYGSVDPEYPAMIRFQIPAEATAEVTSAGHYDVWVANQRVARGPVFVELSVSVLPPRNAMTGSWTPMLTGGQPFVRSIDIAGLLPAGEMLSMDSDFGPELVVSDLSGDEVIRFSGRPWLTTAPERDRIILSLTAIDVATIEPGRFSYVLRAWNTLHEPRTLLAGIMLAEEGEVSAIYASQ